MPTFPWTDNGSAPVGDVLVMASRLPLARYRSIPAFLRATQPIRRQLATADGLIGYSLQAHLLRKTFYTVSAWRDQAALDAFAAAQPHRGHVAAIRPAMRPTTFVTWRAPADTVPVPWSEAHRRLELSSPA